MEQVKKFSDLELTGYLLCKGFKEVSPPVFDGIHIFFCFSATPELEKEVYEFFSGKVQVDLQTFANHQRRLRLIVTEMRRGGMKNV
jgi:hypothetical protein